MNGQYSFIFLCLTQWLSFPGISKKLEAAAKTKENACLALWTKSISNHLYWCSTSSEESDDRKEEVKDKWLSIVNHVADIHTGHGPKYPDCQHGDLEPRAWIRKGLFLVVYFCLTLKLPFS